ncbi:DDE-type integrase/transposase/recombinase, partial [Actinobacillus pleuropneumoniae]
INPPSRQKSYIIVCMDYLTKWAETKAIKAATEEKVAEFLRENIFYKFGYPRELVTDQGSQFTSNLVEDLLAHHKIKHRTSTPYHPQANGQVEVTNRALEGILTKVVSSNRKDWADCLVEATWAYNTTWKTTTGFTPYELVYGKKALLSIDFEYNTLRMEAQLDLDLKHDQ